MTHPLPDSSLLQALNKQFLHRELQISQLAHLIWPSLPSPPTIVIHGVEATGKTAVTTALLQASEIPHAIINCLECITGRHLLERIVFAVEDALALDEVDGETDRRRSAGRCENLNALVVELQRLLEGSRAKFVLVLDGVDRQREAPPSLLPALARLGQLIPSLTTILIVTVPRPRFLHCAGVPYIHFPSYTKHQAVSILSASPRAIFEPRSSSRRLSSSPPAFDQDLDPDAIWLWAQFCGIVWDTLAEAAANDLVGFRATCDKLWRPFVAPIVDGTYGPRDLSRLMISQRALFQTEDAVVESLVAAAAAPSSGDARHGTADNDRNRVAQGAGQSKRIAPSSRLDLPLYSKYLLCAAYLASYSPARQDVVFFMKAAVGQRRRRRRQGASGTTGAIAKVAKSRKIPRTLLSPHPFPLQRLHSIFHALLVAHHPSATDPSTAAALSSADLQTQIATLASLRLILPSSSPSAAFATGGGRGTSSAEGGGRGGGGAGAGSGDVLDGSTKWRFNLSCEVVQQIAREVGIQLWEFMDEEER